MKTDIQELREITDRLRCDLSATWLALAATQTVLTPEQRQAVLTEFSRQSAQKQELYDAPRSSPEAQARVQYYLAQMQASEERVYEVLQGTFVRPPKSGDAAAR